MYERFDPEQTITITFACGHRGPMLARCADAQKDCYCEQCAVTKLPKPSECLKQFKTKNGNHLGQMLGPIGAVIYIRQSQGYAGMLAWSGTSPMFDALEGIDHTRDVQTYIDVFEKAGI